MEFLSRTIKQIQDQLGLLTISQRFAIFLCLVIMFGAIFWMVRYSSEQTMTPLLPMSFSEDDIKQIEMQFGDWRQKYRVRGDQILVPSEDRQTLVGRLGYEQLLPDDTSEGWLTLLGNNGGVFESSKQQQTRNLIIKQMQLASCLKNFPGISQAEVFINPPSERRTFPTPPASAAVRLTLTTKGKEDANLGNTVAGFVSSANKMMKRENVTVVADNHQLQVTPVGQQNPGSYLEVKTDWEQHYQVKIVNALDGVGPIVIAEVEPELDQVEQVVEKILDEGQGSWNPPTTEITEELNSTNTTGAKEPGFQSNGGTGSTAGGGTDRSETTEKSETSKQPMAGRETTKTRKAEGSAKLMSVTVRYPRSFFKLIAQEVSGDNTVEPTEQMIQEQVDLKTPELRQTIMGAVGLTPGVPEDEAKVVFGTFLDNTFAASFGIDSEVEIAAGGTMGSLGSLARGYSKQIAVSALALMSLFMVLMMVKKAGGPIEMEDSEAEALMAPGKKPIDAMSPEDSNFAEAEDAGGLLAGMELDESTVQSQQMLEQIRSMVEDSPDSVAVLVSKWATQGD
ncbi:MAG: hypothetical protein GY869_08265 [Planctomycetes bacterium]|nr:hypothetical protein [Planctomycetota bacterium]